MNEETNNTVVPVLGLTDEEVLRSREAHGENVLTPPKKTSLWRLYIEKYNDPIIKVLIFAALISLGLAVIEGQYVETIGIILAIVLATSIGFWFEMDAARKFDVLTALGEESPVKVVRNGVVTEIARKDVVVGDVVIIEVGDEIPADGRLNDATDLQIDESSLTGEPIVSKYADASKSDKEATYPSYEVLRGTMVMNGRGSYVVSSVGDSTEIGRVARSSTEVTAVKTPLNVQLDKLAKRISKVGFAISVVAFVAFLSRDIIIDANGIWHDMEWIKMAETVLKYFMMAVTLIVMTVPEGMPMAVTLSLALNMRRMLKGNNLVRKLHACETMGAVTVICTDKTGTLTQNKMQVAEMTQLSDDEIFFPSLAANTTAHLDADGKSGIGNPTEIALLLWLGKNQADYKSLRASAKIENQLPFSTERKYMATIAVIGGQRMLLVKGAPEIVTQFCKLTAEEKTAIGTKLTAYQNKAMRTLAFAYRELSADEHPDMSHLNGETPLMLQGIAAISDPVRADVPNAVQQCVDAGINVKIVTGDTKMTAVEIARQIGIWHKDTPDEAHITGPDFAALSDADAYDRVLKLKVMSRARPSDKQRLVNLLQKHGEVVAVTGDGTNDAPALNHAHVGLSLGSGTSVAKEASDMTLIDDSFGSIVNAVMWGRSLYRNIQRFLFFQLIVNVTALLLVLGGSFAGTELPLTVTQILWVNLIMDTFAALALASLPPSKEVMADKPRRLSDFIITRGMAKGIAGVGFLFFIILFAMLIWFKQSAGGIDRIDLSVFFTTFVMIQFWNLLNAKTYASEASAFKNLLSDKGLLMVLAIIIAGQWIIVTFGGDMFRTCPLPLMTWVQIIVGTSIVFWAGEIYRFIARRICKK